MVAWYVFAGYAAFALGAFGIPYKYTNHELSPFAVNAWYGLLLFVINAMLFRFIEDDDSKKASLQFRQAWFWAFLSLSIQISGVMSLMFGLSHKDVVFSRYFAIVSTQTLWATLLSLCILGEWQTVVLWKVVIGSLLIFTGSILMIV
jgi:hypothetical protein